MNSIELKNLTKRYGKFYAVDNLGFEIKQGDFVGFLGVNGAGKSTTVNMLSTILTPDSGEAYLLGYKLGKEDMEIRRSIGVVYQSNVLDDLFTVKENIVTRSKMLGLDNQTISSRLSDLSDILKLSDIMDKRYRVLSGGQMKVVRRLKDGVSKETMAVYAEESIRMVPTKDILYFDAADDHVFAYTKADCFDTKKKLFEIEELLSGSSFLRISKNAIVNIKAIDHLSPEFNVRFIASLKNGEDIIISRGYVPELKKKLGIGK